MHAGEYVVTTGIGKMMQLIFIISFAVVHFVSIILMCFFFSVNSLTVQLISFILITYTRSFTPASKLTRFTDISDNKLPVAITALRDMQTVAGRLYAHRFSFYCFF